MLTILAHVLALYLGGLPANAQTVGATQLLTRGPGAEAAAMAGAILSTVHDPTAIYWNPAGLASAGGMVSGEHLFLFDGARYDFIGITVPSKLGTFGLGALQLDRGNIVARSAINDPGTTVSNTQSLYMLGLGRQLTEHWSAGATANVLDFNLAGYADKGWGVDAGAQGAYPQDEFWGLQRVIWSMGAVVKNLVEPQITLMSDSETFPRELRGGGGLSFQAASRASASGVVTHDRAMILISGRKVSGDPMLYPGLGMAYDFQNVLVFRLGFDGAVTAGMGFHTPDGKFILDYSMENRSLAMANRFTISYRFQTPAAKPQETYAEEIDEGFLQAKTQSEALARDDFATGQAYFKDQKYPEAAETFRLTSLLAPDNEEMSQAYRRTQEAFRHAEIHRLSTDATIDPATGQEAQAYINIAELLDLGAENRDDLLRRLANIVLRLSPKELPDLSRQVLDKRIAEARRLTAIGAVSEALRIEDTLDVFKSTGSAGALAILREETTSRGAALRQAFETASAEERPMVDLAQSALAARRAYPDDPKLTERAAAALARYRAEYPLSMKEKFYLRKLYYLAAVRYARRTGDDARTADDYLTEVLRRDPANEDADALLDAMARDGLARD